MHALTLILAMLDAHASGLSDPDWSVREASSRSLAALYPVSERHLLELLGSDCPEARRRAGEILKGRRSAADPVQRLFVDFVAATGYRNWPWIDSLPEGYPDRGDVISVYRNLARPQAGEDHECWPHYRAGTALFCRDLLKGGKPRAEVVELLRKMVDRDRLQWAQSGCRWEWAGE